jgi:hypothetical protein
MRKCSGTSGAQLYKRVALCVTVDREMDILEDGQGDTTNLNRLLESMYSLNSQGASYKLNLADALHGRAHLLAEGLRWATEHDQEALFKHLLPAVGHADKPALLKQCLALALQNSPSLAIGILAMQTPSAALPQLLASGIQQGAVQEVVLPWLSQLDWMAGHHCAAVVLDTLCNAALFPRLPVLLAERYPAVFESLLAVMCQDKQRYSSYAKALSNHAYEHQGAVLFGTLERGYFHPDRRVQPPSAAPEEMTGHATGTGN